jgi:CxxC motif-containing protein (DUF1111 family)
MTSVKAAAVVAIVPLLTVGALQILQAHSSYPWYPWHPFVASDPGVRGGPAGAGDHLAGLTESQHAFFEQSQIEFEGTEDTGDGLGPRFNLDSCLACHSQPVSGGSSPFENPEVAVATALGATNTLPSFISLDGPIREARFKTDANGSPDGLVHSLFVVSGREDAPGCDAVQEDFEAQVEANNIIFRIPTPLFGAGLMEIISDRAIEGNRLAFDAEKAELGISGRANHSGNDGTITRFGWKAQIKSLLIFSGEAYNVEMGITNDNFQTERDENPNCQFAPEPNSVTNTDAENPPEILSAIEQFGIFMRFLAPATPSRDTPGGATSIASGRQTFSDVGCVLCHTPRLMTGNTTIAALANKRVNLYSDLLLHNMGPGLADDISQGQAKGDEFRSAPLWGLGQRIFFLHDGRTTDLKFAIREHRSAANETYEDSEANASVNLFDALSEQSKQNLLNFLRSL